MFSIDSKAAWLIGERRYHTQLQGMCVSCERKSVCVCLGCRGLSVDTVWQWAKKITLLTIAPGAFLFSKIMNCIDNLSWNTSSLQLFSSSHMWWRWSWVGLSILTQPTTALFWLLLSKIEQQRWPKEPEEFYWRLKNTNKQLFMRASEPIPHKYRACLTFTCLVFKGPNTRGRFWIFLPVKCVSVLGFLYADFCESSK